MSCLRHPRGFHSNRVFTFTLEQLTAKIKGGKLRLIGRVKLLPLITSIEWLKSPQTWPLWITIMAWMCLSELSVLRICCADSSGSGVWRHGLWKVTGIRWDYKGVSHLMTRGTLKEETSELGVALAFCEMALSRLSWYQYFVLGLWASKFGTSVLYKFSDLRCFVTESEIKYQKEQGRVAWVSLRRKINFQTLKWYKERKKCFRIQCSS